jgi:hypothetical protein
MIEIVNRVLAVAFLPREWAFSLAMPMRHRAPKRNSSIGRRIHSFASRMRDMTAGRLATGRMAATDAPPSCEGRPRQSSKCCGRRCQSDSRIELPGTLGWIVT